MSLQPTLIARESAFSPFAGALEARTKRIVTIDFEASCLPRHGRSYPIEVGIADTDRGARSWLIRPHANWAGWDWTDEAEALHGLSRERVEREGLPVGLVVAELKAALKGADVVADSPIDSYWMQTLSDAAGEPMIAPIMELSYLFDLHCLDSVTIFAAMDRVDQRALRRHRAGDDALWLAALLTELGLLDRRDRGQLLPWSRAGARPETERPL